MKSLNICFQASFGQTQYGWLSYIIKEKQAKWTLYNMYYLIEN